MKKAMLQATKFDNLYTPDKAVIPLLSYLPPIAYEADQREYIIWECCDSGNSKITKVLKTNCYNVISTDIITGFDFLNDIPNFNFDLIVTNPPFCYDSETETLTKEGWKLIKNVTINDKVLSLDPISMNIIWDKIEEVISKYYEGQMIHFKHKLIDLLVTPNHRIYAIDNKGRIVTKNKIYGSGRDNKSYELISASDIKSPHQLKRSGFIWRGEEEEFFIIPKVHLTYNKQQRTFDEIKVKMEDWCAFFGIWVAEGSTRGSTKKDFENCKGKQKHLYETTIKQKEPNATIIRKLLNKLPFEIKETKNSNEIIGFTISSVQLWTYLHQFGNSHTKFIPSNLKDLSPKFLNILLKWYLFGDGHINQGLIYFYTVSKKLVDDLTEISVKSGKFVSYIYDKTNKGYKGCLVKQEKAFLAKNKSTIQYNGLIYCLSLEKNHIFLVRRNGKLAFSGNSLKDKFIKKCYEYNKPFALLLPLTALEGIQRGKMYREHGISVIVLDKRIDFTGKGANWFNASWFVWGFLPKNSLIFEAL